MPGINGQPRIRKSRPHVISGKDYWECRKTEVVFIGNTLMQFENLRDDFQNVQCSLRCMISAFRHTSWVSHIAMQWCLIPMRSGSQCLKYKASRQLPRIPMFECPLSSNLSLQLTKYYQLHEFLSPFTLNTFSQQARMKICKRLI